MAAPYGGWVAETFRRALAHHIRSVVTVTCLLAKEALDRQISDVGSSGHGHPEAGKRRAHYRRRLRTA
jgi:hypothetical protein